MRDAVDLIATSKGLIHELNQALFDRVHAQYESVEEELGSVRAYELPLSYTVEEVAKDPL